MNHSQVSRKMPSGVDLMQIENDIEESTIQLSNLDDFCTLLSAKKINTVFYFNYNFDSDSIPIDISDEDDLCDYILHEKIYGNIEGKCTLEISRIMGDKRSMLAKTDDFESKIRSLYSEYEKKVSSKVKNLVSKYCKKHNVHFPIKESIESDTIESLYFVDDNDRFYMVNVMDDENDVESILDEISETITYKLEDSIQEDRFNMIYMPIRQLEKEAAVTVKDAQIENVKEYISDYDLSRLSSKTAINDFADRVMIHFGDECILKKPEIRIIIEDYLDEAGISETAENTIIGQEHEQRDGSIAKIIEYVTSQDITVEFDDGTVMKHVNKAAWLRGTLVNILNKSKMQSCGLEAKVIKYLNSNCMDVEFSDGNKVINVTYNSWNNGTIPHPTLDPISQGIKDKYIGQTKMMECGLEATVIDYADCENITVQFEDGTIKSGISTKSFRAGKVSKD